MAAQGTTVSFFSTEVNFTIVAKETVSDNPKSSSAFVTVHITDTNDNVPEFSSPLYEVRKSNNLCQVKEIKRLPFVLNHSS